MNKYKKIISFRLVLFLLISLILLISCDKEVSTSPPEEPPPQAFIFVDSKPENFKIYLDDRFTGRFTPDTIPFIEGKVQEISLKKKYWKDTTFFVEAKENAVRNVEIDYSLNNSMYGGISFNSVPSNATVIINDSVTSLTTPSQLSGLVPGLYRVEYKLEQHRANIATISVQSSQISNLTLTLRDTSIWVDYRKFNSLLPTDILTSVAVDKNDKVWVGTIEEGLVTIEGSKWELINTGNSLLPSDRILTIEIDDDNTVWVGTENGLAKVNARDNISVYNKESGYSLMPDNVRAIDFAGNGIVWVGTGGGLVKLDGNNVQLFTNRNSDLPRSWINTIKVENDNMIWLGTDFGFVLFDGLTTFDGLDRKENGFPNTNVAGVEIDLDNSVWALFNSQVADTGGALLRLPGGLSVYNRTSWNSIIIGDLSTQLLDIIVDKDNFKWTATNIGLIKYLDINTADVFRINNSGIVSDDIVGIAEDSIGNLWIATRDGLSKYKKYLDTQ